MDCRKKDAQSDIIDEIIEEKQPQKYPLYNNNKLKSENHPSELLVHPIICSTRVPLIRIIGVEQLTEIRLGP